MNQIKVGDILKVAFTTPLPGNDIAPNLDPKTAYECKDIYTDSQGYKHIDVGLPLEIGYVSSYATGEKLPGNTHWCHPNRFIIQPK